MLNILIQDTSRSYPIRPDHFQWSNIKKYITLTGPGPIHSSHFLWCFHNSRSKGPYQSLLSRPKRRDSQVIPALVKGVDVDAPVGVWLFEPVLQHMFEVDALPMARAWVELDLEWADADVAAPLLGDGLQAQDLQVDRGCLLQGSQVNP